MNPERSTTPVSHEQEIAWNILRDSATVRLLGVMPGSHWPQSTRDHLGNDESLRRVRRIDDQTFGGGSAYFRARSEEERLAAAAASGRSARKAHQDLADLYVLVAEAIAHRASSKHTSVEHREALLDDALDDTFPASDPPAIIMPGRNVRNAPVAPSRLADRRQLSILSEMTEHSQFGRPELHPGSSTARL